jgi:hypothetical protein
VVLVLFISTIAIVTVKNKGVCMLKSSTVMPVMRELEIKHAYAVHATSVVAG